MQTLLPLSSARASSAASRTRNQDMNAMTKDATKTSVSLCTTPHYFGPMFQISIQDTKNSLLRNGGSLLLVLLSGVSRTLRRCAPDPGMSFVLGAPRNVSERVPQAPRGGVAAATLGTSYGTLPCDSSGVSRHIRFSPAPPVTRR